MTLRNLLGNPIGSERERKQAALETGLSRQMITRYSSACCTGVATQETLLLSCVCVPTWFFVVVFLNSAFGMNASDIDSGKAGSGEEKGCSRGSSGSPPVRGQGAVKVGPPYRHREHRAPHGRRVSVSLSDSRGVLRENDRLSSKISRFFSSCFFLSCLGEAKEIASSLCRRLTRR